MNIVIAVLLDNFISTVEREKHETQRQLQEKALKVSTHDLL